MQIVCFVIDIQIHNASLHLTPLQPLSSYACVFVCARIDPLKHTVYVTLTTLYARLEAVGMSITLCWERCFFLLPQAGLTQATPHWPMTVQREIKHGDLWSHDPMTSQTPLPALISSSFMRARERRERMCVSHSKDYCGWQSLSLQCPFLLPMKAYFTSLHRVIYVSNKLCFLTAFRLFLKKIVLVWAKPLQYIIRDFQQVQLQIDISKKCVT